MTIGPQDLAGQPKTEFSLQEALNMAWTKNGQLMFEIDIMRKQLMAFEQENKSLKTELEKLRSVPHEGGIVKLEEAGLLDEQNALLGRLKEKQA